MISKLPENLRLYQEEAERFLIQGAVLAIEFSGGTYQVHVKIPGEKESVWSFVQFDEKQRIKDGFCSCEGGEDVADCRHLATAVLAIYGNHQRPLHVRYQNSFWHALAQLAYQEYGDDHSIIKRKKQTTYIGSFAEFLPKTEMGTRQVNSIFFERPIETEETSLKFSNLTLDEIQKWKEGRPSRKLSFELSYWNDLAHWLMEEQEKDQAYQADFTYDAEGLPCRFHVRLPDVDCSIELKEEWWPTLIPVLGSIHTPLFVDTLKTSIGAIRFDLEKMRFVIIPNTFEEDKSEQLLREGQIIGDWIYIPKKGFYPRTPHPLLTEEYPVEKILDQYGDLVSERMGYPPIHLHPVNVVYDLHFDTEWNLRIVATLPNFGVLEALFGTWGFHSKGGFFHLDGVVFNEVETVIPTDQVVDFVTAHKLWLDHQPGFQIHLAGIETTYTYQLTDEDRLILSQKALIDSGEGHAKDFGKWVYFEGQGFYPKTSSTIQLPIEDTLVLSSGQIPFFIRTHFDELMIVPHFFHSECPVKKSGVRVELLGSDTLIISPEFQLRPGEDLSDVRFFDEYVFVKDKGFCALPPNLRLPDRFSHTLTLRGDAFHLFLTREMEQIRDSILALDPKLTPPASLELIIEGIERDHGKYDVKAHYQTERGTISLRDIFDTIKSRKRFLFSPAGLLDTTLDRFQWLNEIQMNEPLVLSALDLVRLAAFDPPKVGEGKELLDELLSFKVLSQPDISLLRSQLRPYQRLGVNWLWFLYQHGLSGLLCDDMGLGKTHQSMALISSVRLTQSKKQPFLIICPTSVIYHWEDKLSEFLPGLNVRTFYGTGRSMEGFHKEDDILLTSYGIWRREWENLREIAFDLAIFDEIQSAKNQKSRIHFSLQKVNARIKIGLTGTPIENRLRELKALFDLILPGYMLQEKAFKEFFVLPIEKENNQDRKVLLSRFVKPFIMRRKKEEVLLDLPEKVEEVSHCQLSLDQKMLYSELLNKVRAPLIQELKDSSSVPYLHVFSVLSSLKQICNHPAAYLKNPGDYQLYESGKWELFKELLSEALESGQKVVVFSQYLAMLDIMQLYLEEQQLEFASIRGSTLDRGDIVRRFNQNPNCQVFLGSLHAAGLGIDLTSASVVIHYDRWWNAAREDQATDRVHRIGQQRGVQVFKLVTLDTLEERIDQMITKKGKLMEEVVGVDDHRFMKLFDRQELIELLSFSLE